MLKAIVSSVLPPRLLIHISSIILKTSVLPYLSLGNHCSLIYKLRPKLASIQNWGHFKGISKTKLPKIKFLVLHSSQRVRILLRSPNVEIMAQMRHNIVENLNKLFLHFVPTPGEDKVIVRKLKTDEELPHRTIKGPYDKTLHDK